MSVGNWVGVSDGTAVDVGVKAGEVRVLEFGDEAGATGAMHPTRDNSRTKSNKQAYRPAFEVFILRVPFCQLPATASASTPGMLTAMYCDLTTPAR